MAERRVSSRGSRPTKKVLDTQAIDAARRQHKAREAASIANRTPFQARGEQHASSLRDGEEPQEEESGDSSGEDEEEVVWLSRSSSSSSSSSSLGPRRQRRLGRHAKESGLQWRRLCWQTKGSFFPDGSRRRGCSPLGALVCVPFLVYACDRQLSTRHVLTHHCSCTYCTESLSRDARFERSTKG